MYREREGWVDGNTRKRGEPDAGWDVCILGTATVPGTPVSNGTFFSFSTSVSHVAALLGWKYSAVIGLWQWQATSAAALGPLQVQQQLFNCLNILPSQWNTFASSRSNLLSSASVTLTVKAGLIKTRSSHSTTRKIKVDQSQRRDRCRCVQRRLDPYIH